MGPCLPYIPSVTYTINGSLPSIYPISYLHNQWALAFHISHQLPTQSMGPCLPYIPSVTYTINGPLPSIYPISYLHNQWVLAFHIFHQLPTQSMGPCLPYIPSVMPRLLQQHWLCHTPCFFGAVASLFHITHIRLWENNAWSFDSRILLWEIFKKKKHSYRFQVSLNMPQTN